MRCIGASALCAATSRSERKSESSCSASISSNAARYRKLRCAAPSDSAHSGDYMRQSQIEKYGLALICTTGPGRCDRAHRQVLLLLLLN